MAAARKHPPSSRARTPAAPPASAPAPVASAPKASAPKASAPKASAPKASAPKASNTPPSNTAPSNTPASDARVRAPRASRSPRIPKGGPKKSEIKRLRELLVALRARLHKSNAELSAGALRATEGDVSVDHMADHGSDSYEQAFTLSLLEEEGAVLVSIQNALDKIDGKLDLAYGMCEACGEESPESWNPETTQPWIPIGRLDVVPYATLCVPHQEAIEDH